MVDPTIQALFSDFISILELVGISFACEAGQRQNKQNSDDMILQNAFFMIG